MSVTRRRTASHHETSRALNVTVTLQLATIASSCACRVLLRALLQASAQNDMMKTNQPIFLQCHFLGAIQITWALFKLRHMKEIMAQEEERRGRTHVQPVYI